MGAERELVYVWEYKVRADRIEEFLSAYGPGGDWVKLFEKAEGYISTELLEDSEVPLRFLTVDQWRSKAARDRFRDAFDEEFRELDSRCEGFTEKEIFLGDFEVVREY